MKLPKKLLVILPLLAVLAIAGVVVSQSTLIGAKQDSAEKVNVLADEVPTPTPTPTPPGDGIFGRDS